MKSIHFYNKYKKYTKLLWNYLKTQLNWFLFTTFWIQKIYLDIYPIENKFFYKFFGERISHGCDFYTVLPF